MYDFVQSQKRASQGKKQNSYWKIIHINELLTEKHIYFVSETALSTYLHVLSGVSGPSRMGTGGEIFWVRSQAVKQSTESQVKSGV